VPLNLSNSLLFIATKSSQKVVQNLRIHCHVILNLRALFPNRWASRLAQLYGNIMTRPQMLHRNILGCIGCINTKSKFGPIFCPMHTLFGNRGKGNTSKTKKYINTKPNVKINNLDEGYPL